MSGQELEEKSRALRAHGAWNPRWERVREPRFAADDFFDARDLVQVKYEMLRRVREEKLSVAAAARVFGFSRVRYYQILRDFQSEGLAGLLPRPKGPRRAHKLTAAAMAFIERQLRAKPTMDSGQLAQALGEQMAIHVHARSIERALARGPRKKGR